MIPRSKPLSRGSPPKRKTPVKKVNRARKAKNWKRAYRSEAYVLWCKSQPCIACGRTELSEVAHVGSGGIGRKADAALTVPLCGPVCGEDYFGTWHYEGCHRLLHRTGHQSFEERFNLDLDAEAEKCQARWLEYSQPGSLQETTK